MGSTRRSVAVVVFLAACGGSEREPTYGGVAIVVRSAEADPAATFDATATISATLGYGACLVDFYDEHDDDAFAESEGKAIVGEWRDALCEVDEAAAPAIACEVVGLEQHLDDGAPRLVATFSVTGEIEGRELAVGPFPDPASARCRGGALPGLHVGADALVGRDVDDVEIWRAEPTDDDIAVVDQAAPIGVYATRVPAP
jgi:hypothetical protein